MREVRMVAELFGARLREFFHIVFAAKMQAAGGARFDARRLEAFADAVGAKRALEDAMRLRVHLRNVEWAAGNAVTAADAVGLLEVHDAVGVLDDGPIGGTRRETTRVGRSEERRVGKECRSRWSP